MAAHGWGKSASVEEWLLAEAHRFDFYQAVALLEAMLAPPSGVGEGSEPSMEAIRFKSTISLAFPESDIDSIQLPEKGYGERHAMKVNFMSLAGAVGPLPPPFAELLVQRSARHDVAAREFLDIFNHRLISIAYRIRKRHRIGLGAESPLHDDTARQLFAFMGLGAGIFPEKIRAAHRALLHHAGTFARETRSMAGLESMLRYHFGVPIEGVQFTGGFYKLDSEELTAIGPSGKNRTLGRDALIGARVWDQTASFELRVGPLNLDTFMRFLPKDGDALGPLCEIVRFYVGDVFDFSVRLVLSAPNVPPTRLGHKPGNLLGYTAWIGSGRGRQGPPEVNLSSHVVEAELKRWKAERAGHEHGHEHGHGHGDSAGDAGHKDDARRGAAV